MKQTKSTLTVLAGLFVILTLGSGARATTLRAYVSSTGSDVNSASNCQQANPCRTFAGALPTVTPGGELIALDTAGYGPLNGPNTINKAITIAAIPGATAFVVVSPFTVGFSINVGASDLIILRNITFNGSKAVGTSGIAHFVGKLEVYDCKFVQLTYGMSLANSKASLYNCIFVGNVVAASVDGTGVDAFGGGTATALLTVSGGSITNNGTAFSTVSPGASPKYNIWVHGPSNGVWFTNIAHNDILIAGSGTGCPCTNVGTYNGGLGNPH